MALYPPIIEYSMPAFSYEVPSVRIYFGLSDFNSKSDIRNVHMTVRTQNDNRSALHPITYPSQIKVCNFREVTPTENAAVALTPYRYYVELTKEDLKDGFQQDIVYKIQLRFSSDNTILDGQGQINQESVTSRYFSEHTSQFSEWSTVCLIKAIKKPTITLVDLQPSEDQETTIIFPSTQATFIAKYQEGEKGQTLKTWRMQLFEYPYTQFSEPISDSGEQVYNSYDAPVEELGEAAVRLEYSFPYELKNEERYVIVVTTESKNGYVAILQQEITVMNDMIQPFPTKIEITPNEEKGYITIKVGYSSQLLYRNVTLRRTTSASNYMVWEDIANHIFEDHSSNSVDEYQNQENDWNYIDFTVEAGTYYKYGVQLRDLRGRRGLLSISDVVQYQPQDAFLLETSGDLSTSSQLTLRYDFQISQASTTVLETKVDTLGSKYPFIRRNGSPYYRTFQGSGLITAFMDDNNLFTNDEELFGTASAAQLHNVEWGKQTLSTYKYDYIKERNFRQKVQQFLYDGKVKLFKSLQQGNILVRLMDISLTPKTELGRLLYTFSATFVEINEASLKNFEKFGFFSIGSYKNIVDFTQTKIGQVSYYELPYFYEGQNILDYIKDKYNVGQSLGLSVKTTDFYLTYLKITMESDPYLIKKVGNQLVPLEDGASTEGVDLISGWLLNIKGQQVLIQKPNNVYELKGKHIYIDSTEQVYPLKDCQMTLDFVINLKQTSDTANLPISIAYKKINTQVADSFATNYSDYYGNERNGADVITILKTRYNEVTNDYTVEVFGVYEVSIEADPNTVVYIKESIDEEPSRYVINETGVLSIMPNDEQAYTTTIDSIVFYGKTLDIRKDLPSGYQYIDNVGGYLEEHQRDLHSHHHHSEETYVDYDIYFPSQRGQDKTVYIYYNGTWCGGTQKDSEGYIYDFCVDKVDATVNCMLQTIKKNYKRETTV